MVIRQHAAWTEQVAYQCNRTASAVPPRHSLMKCCKFVEPIHDPILITARHVVMVDIGRLGTEPLDPDDAISDYRRRLVRRQIEWRSAKFGSFGADQDLARRRFLLQFGGNVHGRAGNVEALDCIATTFA